MNLPSSPLFENIKSPCPSGTASPVETQDSLSSSLMGSPLGLRNISPLPRPSNGTPKPSITPSLLDSPLSRQAPSLQFPQHSRYYFEDDMAVFLVEDCLFRVHRYHLDRESEVFPKGTGSNRVPIELPGVTRTEFESLLDFLYDGMHNETTPSLSAWSSLLSISTHFEMKRIRSRAIAEILSFRPRIDPVDQVVLAVRYDIPEWLPLGYAALCQREEAIEVEEARKLGLETTVMLAKAREVVRKNNSGDQNCKEPEKSIDCDDIHWSRRASQIPVDQDPDPFDAALVSRVVGDIFWPLPVSPDLEKSASKMPETPSPGLSEKALPGWAPSAALSPTLEAEQPSDSPPPISSWGLGISSPQQAEAWPDQSAFWPQPAPTFLRNPEPIEIRPIPNTGVPRLKSVTNKKKGKGGKY